MSPQSQLNLTYAKSEDPQLDLFARTVEPEIHFLLEIDPELARWRRRALFLTSIFLHIFLIMLIIYAPDILRRGRLMMGIPVAPRPSQQITTLFLPPDLLKSLRQPPPEARPSDKNREAQGRAPKIDPNGIHMPYSRGNTPEPETLKGPPPSSPPAAAPTPPPGGPPAPPQQQSAPPKPEPQLDAGLRMEDVTPPGGGGAGKFHMPSLTPGEAIQQAQQGAAGRGYHPESGSGAGGDSNMEFNNLHPNFSTEAPTILSDTMGVDFGPYLARILYTIKRNWIAVSPESVRLGEKGRVVTVFEILRNGDVPQLRLVASSGSNPLDRAAMTGIHASVPFPPLPQEFTGPHLVIQLTFLYNLSPQY